MVGMHKLLCNNCGLVFKGFDPLAHQRASLDDAKPDSNKRRGPRFYAHLPTGVSLIEGDTRGGKVTYSQPSRGHCEAISNFGMRLSLVGARFPEAELSRIGRLLFIRIDLQEGGVEAVVAIVTSDRAGEGAKKKWVLGVKIQQISDADRERLTNYLDKRAKGEPLILPD
jgi:hypothetical protein